MAVIDTATSVFLDAENMLQEQYWPGVIDNYAWFPSVSNRIYGFLKDGEYEATGDGVTIQTWTTMQDSARISRNMHADIPRGRIGTDDKIKYRFSESDPTAMDFARLALSAKVTLPQMWNKAGGAAVDIAQDTFTKMVNDADQKLAAYRNSPKSGRLALVNGTPVENDADTVESATTTADNTDGLRCYVDNGSISCFQPGTHVDFYRSGVLIVGNVEVTDYNADPNEMSVGFKFNATGTDTSTGDLANVADNDEIYYSGAYNQGMNGVEEWFNSSPTAGESWIGGKDRTTLANRWLRPLFTRKNESAETISALHFNQAGQMINFRLGMSQKGYAAICDPAIANSLLLQFPDSQVVNVSQEGGGTRNVDIGADAVYIRHPMFGRIELVADPFCKPNVVRLLNKDDWVCVNWNKAGFQRLPGSTAGYWNRLPSDTPGAGYSLVYQTDALMVVGDLCKRPNFSVAILSVTA